MHPNRPALAAFLCLGTNVLSSQFSLTEVMYHPPPGLPEWVEIVNLTSNRIDAANWRLAGGVDYTFPDFNAAAPADHFINEYERIVLSSASDAVTRAAYPSIPPNVRVFGPWTGSLNNAGDNVRLLDAAGAEQTALTYGDGGLWPRSPDGTGHTLQIIDQNRKVDDWRNWRAGGTRLGTPGYAEPAMPEEPVGSPEQDVRPVTTLKNYTDSWRYWRNAADPDGAGPESSWMGTAFNDSAWPQGNGFFGHEPGTASLSALIQTSFASGYVSSTLAYYFRTTFEWNGSLTGNNFVLDQYVDDGVVYYLNGQELKGVNQGRVRMNPGVPAHTTQASGLPGSGDAFEELEALSGSLDGQLINGTNLLCAEVHQNGTGSSDTFFGARLRILGNAPTGPVINEVKPGGNGQGFVEFFNPAASPVNLQNWYLSDDPGNLTKFQITASVVVPPSGFATVGFAESNLGLNSPVTVILTQPDGNTRQNHLVSSMTIDGRSLGRKPAGGASWFIFSSPTPGTANASSGGAGSAAPLLLSEARFNASGNVDWVEFHNPATSTADMTGFFIASQPGLGDKAALSGTIPPGGYASVNVSFAPDGDGDLTLYLSDASDNVLAAVDIEHRPGLPSVQAWPANGAEWYGSASDTRDAANNPARQTAVVINEIMFDPPSKQISGEFIELTNRGASPVNLGGWRFNRGVDYDFPANVMIAPGEFIVVAADPAWITATYGAGVRVYGPWQGQLANSGDYVRLEDANQNLADAVDYKAGGQWPDETGGGSSLELRHPDMDNSLPSAWLASDESAKASFETYTLTGQYRQLRGAPTAENAYEELLVNLVSDGHIVLRNMHLSKSTAPAVNLLPPGTPTAHNGTGSGGFHAKGTHRLSDTLAGEFHLISTGGGDTKGNLAEVDVTGIAANDILTLTFDARWVSGLPLLVTQTWDRSFGRVWRLPVPNSLGTPGAPNSRLLPFPAPTVDGLRHTPAVPSSTQPVLVTARVTSSAALSSVSLRERVDTVAGNGAYSTTAMNDSGTGGDSVAGDGIWSATVPARADGTITQFFVEATAINGQASECPRDGAGVARINGSVLEVPRRPAMWIVDNSPPSTQPGILSERHIFSLYDRNAMTTGVGFSATYDWDFPEASNFGLNSTVILNELDVFYNCELRKGGSPWTRNGGNSMERLRWKPPGDNQFRGRSRYAIDSDGSATNTEARFHNRLARYLMYLFGYPIPDAEFVQVTVNGDATTWRDSMELTDADFFDRAYGGGGELFEIDDAWYMYDTNSGDDRLSADSVTGRWDMRDWTNPSLIAWPSEHNAIWYHGNWPVRFPEDRYDYSSLNSLMRITTNNHSGITTAQEAPFREQMDRLFDHERAAIYTAVRGYLSDWDNFTRDRGKNGYLYRRPTDGKFEFHHWDSDLGWQTGRINDSFIGSVGSIGWVNYSNRPWFRSRFNHYLTQLVNRYTGGSPRTTAWLNAMNYQAANTHPNAPFKTAAYNYATVWFPTRDNNARNFIGTNNLNRAFAVSTANNQTVATPVFTLNGEASSNTARVEVTGHPEAVLTWVPTFANYGLWTLSGLTLSSGLNALTVRAIAGDGTVISSLNFNVTLSVNAPPVVLLDSNPASRRVSVNEEIVLDATGSYDPEGTALSFSWTVSPSSGVTIGHSVPGKTEARFPVPGLYTVSVTVTDGAAVSAVAITEVTVYNAGDFTPFAGGAPLPAGFTVQHAEPRDNYSPSAWYSVEDNSGRLLLQVLEDSAKPLASPAFTHPVISRDLPDTTDFILQTGLEPDTREFGDWQTGLWLEMTEGGGTVRYVLSLEGGLSVAVRRAALPAAWTQSAARPSTGSGATLRIRRSGSSLIFQHLDAGTWTTVHTQALPAGSIAVHGGVFLATTVASSARTSFDYLLVSDPAATDSVLASLRITEIMYNPGGPGGIEFIELTNTGSQPIQLAGCYFEEGRPVSQFTFPSYLLQPGAFVILTDATPAAFFAAYPQTPPGIVFQWASGGLNNGGEAVTLRDSFGNIILDFNYDDDPLAGWPQGPDGGGYSLEIVSTTGDYDSPANWTAGTDPGGTPGRIGGGPDADGDGYSDSQEQIAGTNPADGSSFFNATGQILPGGQRITWPSFPGRTYHIETNPDLHPGNWTRRGTVVHPAGQPAGTGQFTVSSPAPANAGRTNYRVLVELTP